MGHIVMNALRRQVLWLWELFAAPSSVLVGLAGLILDGQNISPSPSLGMLAVIGIVVVGAAASTIAYVGVHAVLRLRNRGAGTSSIRRAPGSLLAAIAGFACSQKILETVFTPLLADLHYEYCDALSAGRRWKARWVRVCYTGSFLAAALALLPIGVTKLAVRLWRMGL